MRTEANFKIEGSTPETIQRGLTESESRYSEISASRQFAIHHADGFKFCPEWRTWLLWDGTRWVRDISGSARLEVKSLCDGLARIARHDLLLGLTPQARDKAARTIESRRYVDNVLSLAEVELSLVGNAEQFDRDSLLLNTPGGTYDLRTNVLREHRRMDLITKCTSVSPGSGSGMAFRTFLNDVTCGRLDLAKFLQCALGACLSGGVSDHWLMFWYGRGANGKNTLGDLVCAILGDYAKVIPTNTLMADAHGNRHPTEIANLRGVRLAVSSEVAEGEHWHETRIKELTGDMYLCGRFMRQDYFEFQRTHKHVIYGNHRPMLRIVDPAFARRLHIVPFDATFSLEAGTLDTSMPARLHREAPQVLSWLIEGHQLWREDGTLRRCQAVNNSTQDYLETQATLDHWIEERLRKVPDDGQAGRYWPKSSALYADYVTWKKERGEHPLSLTRWGEQMAQRFRVLRADGRRIAGVDVRTGFETRT